MGRTLAVPLPMRGAAALAAGVEEAALVASAQGTVEVPTYRRMLFKCESLIIANCEVFSTIAFKRTQ